MTDSKTTPVDYWAVEDSIVDLTVEKAQELVELPRFHGDRPLSEAKVREYAEKMKDGTFRAEQVCIQTCTLDGVERRLNAQHVLFARYLQRDVSDVHRFPVKLVKWATDSEQGLMKLHAVIDCSVTR